MRLGRRSGLIVVGLVALAGCGSSSSAKTSAVGTATRTDRPTAAARMVCAAEAQKDIAQAIGVQTSKPPTSTWARRTYSCPYTYATGTIALSVKESSGLKPTVGYFDTLARDLGTVSDVTLAFGDASFLATDGSVVVRKDHLVLLVDVTGLPDQFGHPPSARSVIAQTVAETIMGCWTGS